MDTGLLIIGSGISALACALKSSQFMKVIIATKDDPQECSSNYAQGGLAAVFGRDDSFDIHLKDTLRAGDGLCDKKAASRIIRQAPSQILWLKKQGVRFDRQLSREAVHSRSRIVHSGDITGERVEGVLLKNAQNNANITILPHHFAVDLKTSKGRCYGASFLKSDGEMLEINAGFVVLATGGLGRLYLHTCNPKVATADGFAMAFRAGAKLADMEFVQFHPTGLHGSNPTFLISETLRGEGGRLLNIHKRPYMEYYHRDGDLAPRDVVSKFSFDEMKKHKSEHVYLDVRHLGKEYLQKRFPRISKACRKVGVDISSNLIPVSPTAHYSCGGIVVDGCAMTKVKGLYAVGEVACTGMHGADRLASNSLTEALVLADIASSGIIKKISGKPKMQYQDTINTAEGQSSKAYLRAGSNDREISMLKKKLQRVMWDKVGIIRTDSKLSSAIEDISSLQKMVKPKSARQSLELRNMLLTAKVIAVAARRRKESRGTHYSADHPERDDKNWQKHLTLDDSSIQKFL